MLGSLVQPRQKADSHCCPRQNGGFSVPEYLWGILERGSGDHCSGGPKGRWMEGRRGGQSGAAGRLGSIGFTRAAGKREW